MPALVQDSVKAYISWTQPHSLLDTGSLCTAIDTLNQMGITRFISSRLINVGALPAATEAASAY